MLRLGRNDGKGRLVAPRTSVFSGDCLYAQWRLRQRCVTFPARMRFAVIALWRRCGYAEFKSYNSPCMLNVIHAVWPIVGWIGSVSAGSRTRTERSPCHGRGCNRAVHGQPLTVKLQTRRPRRTVTKHRVPLRHLMSRLGEHSLSPQAYTTDKQPRQQQSAPQSLT